MWEPPRAIRFDFHVYGHYLIVDPAPHAGPQSSASPSGGEQRRLTNAAPDTRGR
jgi:hypothetical protein